VWRSGWIDPHGGIFQQPGRQIPANRKVWLLIQAFWMLKGSPVRLSASPQPENETLRCQNGK
jgi:hypothetical protein